MNKPAFNRREEDRGRHIADYWPLAILAGICVLGAFAIGESSNASHLGLMHYFMGLFLVCFAMLKLFHPASFADGFSMYDLLAKRVRVYAYIYPYIELGLGLAYLAFAAPQAVYIATIVVFSFGALGVVSALKRGLDINCPCMGSILNVPLSTVTLTEDLAMVVMAGWMLFSL